MPRHAKLTKVARNQSLLTGIRKHMQDVVSLRLNGVEWKVTDLIALLERHIEAIDETTRQESRWHDTIAREQAIEQEVRAVARGIWRHVRAQLLPVTGGDSLRADFGMRRSQKERTVASKALAAEKARATRAARGTKGKRQRAKIKSAG
jgi:hypothetical protein